MGTTKHDGNCTEATTRRAVCCLLHLTKQHEKVEEKTACGFVSHEKCQGRWKKSLASRLPLHAELQSLCRKMLKRPLWEFQAPQFSFMQQKQTIGSELLSLWILLFDSCCLVFSIFNCLGVLFKYSNLLQIVPYYCCCHAKTRSWYRFFNLLYKHTCNISRNNTHVPEDDNDYDGQR